MGLAAVILYLNLRSRVKEDQAGCLTIDLQTKRGIACLVEGRVDVRVKARVVHGIVHVNIADSVYKQTFLPLL